MPVEQKVKNLIEDIENTKREDYFTQSKKIASKLEEEILSSNDIDDLKDALALISAELPKIITANPRNVFALGAGIGAVGGYLAKNSFFAAGFGGIIGGLVCTYAMMAKNICQLGLNETQKQYVRHSLQSLNTKLNKRIQILQKQEKALEERQAPAGGLRHRLPSAGVS